MAWMILGGLVVGAGAVFSLIASRNSRRDVASGHPTYESVADLTGVWDRSQLDERLGPRDHLDRYTATAAEVDQIPRAWWKLLLDTDAGDVFCLLMTIAAPLAYHSFPNAGLALLAAAATYCIAGYLTAIVFVVRSESQKRDNSDSPIEK